MQVFPPAVTSVISMTTKESCSIGAPFETRHQATINIYISTFNSHALTCSRLQKTQHRYLTEICKKTQTLPHPLNSPTLYDTTQWPGCRLVHTPLDTQTPCHDTYLGETLQLNRIKFLTYRYHHGTLKVPFSSGFTCFR